MCVLVPDHACVRNLHAGTQMTEATPLSALPLLMVPKVSLLKETCVEE